MNKITVEYKKNGEKVKNQVSSYQLKKLLKDVVKIQICTRNESLEMEDSVLSFLKKYKKYGVKNLSEKYKTSEDTILGKLMSLGIKYN